MLWDIAFTVILFVTSVIINYLVWKRMKGKFEKDKIEMQKSLNLLKTLLNKIPSPIFYKDTKGRYIDWNDAFEEFVGIERKEILNKTFYDFSEYDLAFEHEKMDEELVKTNGKRNYETKFMYADGKMHDVIIKKAAIIQKGKIEGIAGIIIDITNQKNTENKLNRLIKIKDSILEINHSIVWLDSIEELFKLILEKAIGAINHAKFGSVLVLGEDGMLRAVASKGYDETQIKDFTIGLEHSFIWIKAKGNISGTTLINNVDMLDEFEGIEAAEKNKEWKIKSCISTPIMINNKLYGMINIDSNSNDAFNEEDIEIMNYLRSQVEIAINKHNLYQKNKYLSNYDSLTDIYNRRHFEELVKEYYKKAIKDNTKFSVVNFDLNNFKMVNDTYGHDAGDEYIKALLK